MIKRIWFKKDCVKWILEGKKTTTFRSRRHEGEYEIVEGSRFKAKGLGIFLKLTLLSQTNAYDIIHYLYMTEGKFDSSQEFEEWLKKNKLELPEYGYLHKIEVIKK
jgi:hypothetical protein